MSKKNYFPKEVFPTWFTDMTSAVSAMMQTPEELAVSFGLTAVSACLAQKMHVAMRTMTVPVNIWTLTLMPAGSGKSTVCKIMTDSLHKTIVEESLFEDITVHQFYQRMNRTQKLVMLTAEGTLFDTLLGPRKMSYTAFLHAFDEERLCYDHGETCLTIEHASLTIGTSLQNERFRQYYNSPKFQELLANGLFDRFLLTAPEPLIGKRCFSLENATLPSTICSNYENKLCCLTASDGIHGMFSLNDNACKDFIDWRNALEKEFNDDSPFAPIQQWLSKMPGFVLRLSGLLFAMRTVTDSANINQDITSRDLQKAIKLAEYYRDELLEIMESIDRPEIPAAKKLWNYLMKQDVMRITRRTACHGVHSTSGLRTTAEFDATLAILAEQGLVNVEIQKTHGPKTTIIYLHPEKKIHVA